MTIRQGQQRIVDFLKKMFLKRSGLRAEDTPSKKNFRERTYSVAPWEMHYEFKEQDVEEGFVRLECIATHKETGVISVTKVVIPLEIAEDMKANEEQRNE